MNSGKTMFTQLMDLMPTSREGAVSGVFPIPISVLMTARWETSSGGPSDQTAAHASLAQVDRIKS